jgi:hypothetical protein
MATPCHTPMDLFAVGLVDEGLDDVAQGTQRQVDGRALLQAVARRA